MDTIRRAPAGDDLSRRLARLVFETGDRPYIAVADDLASPTHADNERHAMARAALVTALQSDRRVRAVFDAWGRSSRLDAAAETVARAVAAAGAAERARPPDDNRPLTPSERRVVRELATATKRLKARWEAFRQHPVPAPDTFVRETLKLPWPWVAVELVDAFRRRLVARAYGVPVVRGFRADVQAPALAVSTRPGEPIAEARRRFQEATRALEQAARLPKGRRATRRGAHVTRNVQWYYRARVKDPAESIRQLAREYHQVPGHKCGTGDDRTPVQQGIRDATRWLGLTTFRFPGGPSPPC